VICGKYQGKQGFGLQQLHYVEVLILKEHNIPSRNTKQISLHSLHHAALPTYAEPCCHVHAGAILTGTTHFLSTAKKLNEEGVDAVARLRAVPIAVSLLECHTCIMSYSDSLLPGSLLSEVSYTTLVLQVKALAVSTAATAAVGTAALVAMNCIGMPSREVADVSSWQGAILVMQQHRVCFQAWFAVRMSSQSEARIHPCLGNVESFMCYVDVFDDHLCLFHRTPSKKNFRNEYRRATNRVIKFGQI